MMRLEFVFGPSGPRRPVSFAFEVGSREPVSFGNGPSEPASAGIGPVSVGSGLAPFGPVSFGIGPVSVGSGFAPSDTGQRPRIAGSCPYYPAALAASAVDRT